jgi:hypothetical protein
MLQYISPAATRQTSFSVLEFEAIDSPSYSLSISFSSQAREKVQ